MGPVAIRVKAEVDVEDRLEVLWHNQAGEQAGGDPRGHREHDRVARTERDLCVGPAHAGYATAFEGQFRDTAVEPYVGSALPQGGDGGIDQCL